MDCLGRYEKRAVPIRCYTCTTAGQETQRRTAQKENEREKQKKGMEIEVRTRKCIKGKVST